MTEHTFTRIVNSFADHLELSPGKLEMELRDEIVEVDVLSDSDGVRVRKDDEVMPATRWIYKHLAKLDVLARRISKLIVPPKYFVVPSGKLLDNVDEDPLGREEHVNDVSKSIRTILDRRFGATSVLYLTSEAGEGKTSIIEHFAVQQAEAYLRNQAKWLLLPVPLGGRPFLRFDDVVIAALVNRLRFPFWYYGGFLELVRLGVIVPAFDGFEEMIVERGSDEARSAFKNLVGELHSEGSLLVAARRSFFDLSFSSQARLWKSVTPDDNVLLQRLSLNRWDKKVFIAYAEKRSLAAPAKLYADVSTLLPDRDHPVLTRAVLVRRLIDVAEKSQDLPEFLARIGQNQTNYFHEFVEGIVRREADHKWLDRSGGDKANLLSLNQHHELLSMIAFEMWFYSVEVLGMDVITLIVELFAEQHGLTPDATRQVQERIKDHSLLRAQKQSGRNVVTFDHDDFRAFYLGQALGNALTNNDMTAITQILDAKALSVPVISEAARIVSDSGVTVFREVVAHLQKVVKGAQQVSYVRENCGMLMLTLFQNSDDLQVMDSVSFAQEALAGKQLCNLTFEGSFFAPTRLTGTRLRNCTFNKCQFERLIIDGAADVQDSILKDCVIHSLAIASEREEVRNLFNPAEIQTQLTDCGFQCDSPPHDVMDAAEPVKNDQDLDLTLRYVNMYLRATSLSMQSVSVRLGEKSGYFFNRVLPRLKQKGLVGDFGTSALRLRLMVPLDAIEKAQRKSAGSFNQFVSLF